MRRRRFIVHSFAHAVNDSYSGFLAPLLPLLSAKHGLSLSGAGLLVTLQTLAASLSQPLWGWCSDRYPGRWYVPGGIFAAGFFLSLIGLAPSHFSLGLVILLGGLGVASFHPAGAVLATAQTKRRQGLAMALFIGLGSGGYALGPVMISWIVAARGLTYTYIAFLPALVMVVVWLRFGPRPEPKTDQPVASARPTNLSVPIPWKTLALLSATSAIRAFTLLTYLNFLPFYLKDQGLGLKERGFYLFTLQFGDALGNLLGGLVSDRLGRWRVMFWSPLLAVPFLVAFLRLSGGVALLPLFLAGILLFASAPAVVLSSQKLMVNREGVGSALQVGFAWGTAGLFMSLVGKVGELIGIYQLLLSVSLFPALISLITLWLRKERVRFEA